MEHLDVSLAGMQQQRKMVLLLLLEIVKAVALKVLLKSVPHVARYHIAMRIAKVIAGNWSTNTLAWANRVASNLILVVDLYEIDLHSRSLR